MIQTRNTPLTVAPEQLRRRGETSRARSKSEDYERHRREALSELSQRR